MMNIAPRMAQGIPSIRVCPDVFLNICHSVLNALSKIKAGKNMAIIPFGFS